MSVVKTSLISLTALFTALHVFAHKLPILAVDLETQTTDRTQEHFTHMIVGDQVNKVTPAIIGDFTVTISAGSSVKCFLGEPHTIAYNSRDRTNNIKTVGSFVQMDLIDLIRERVAAWGAEPIHPNTGLGTGPGLYLLIEGLKPNTPYTLQAWGVDHEKKEAKLRNGYAYGFDATFELPDYKNLPLLGSYTITGSPDSIPDNHLYSITGKITSDRLGRIIYKSVSNIDGCGILNGFIVTQVESATPAQP